jgi:D-amino peptidase
MRVFISADMEGISGVASPHDVVREGDAYEQGQALVHHDVNAAVAGAVAGGAEEVLVNDSHSSMRNLDIGALDGRATLIRGNTKPRSMVQGLDSDHDVAMFVGYHAMAGTAGAVLNHTFLDHEVVTLHVDGTEMGELGWTLRFAAALDVPLGLVTGDDATIAEAASEPGEPETVAVKTGIDRFTARCRPRSETRDDIEQAARRAVERAGDGTIPVPSVDGKTTVAVDWATTNHAAAAAGTPAVERNGGRRTAVTADSYVDAFESAVAMLRAGANGSNDYYG